eukprot:227291-Amphidinium_carterae.1
MVALRPFSDKIQEGSYTIVPTERMQMLPSAGVPEAPTYKSSLNFTSKASKMKPRVEFLESNCNDGVLSCGDSQDKSLLVNNPIRSCCGGLSFQSDQETTVSNSQELDYRQMGCAHVASKQFGSWDLCSTHLAMSHHHKTHATHVRTKATIQLKCLSKRVPTNVYDATKLPFFAGDHGRVYHCNTTLTCQFIRLESVAVGSSPNKHRSGKAKVTIATLSQLSTVGIVREETIDGNGMWETMHQLLGPLCRRSHSLVDTLNHVSHVVRVQPSKGDPPRLQKVDVVFLQCADMRYREAITHKGLHCQT